MNNNNPTKIALAFIVPWNLDQQLRNMEALRIIRDNTSQFLCASFKR